MIPERDKFFSLERRKFSRLKENIFILYRLNSADFDEFNKAFSKNISGGGLCLEVENEIPARSELELELYQPIKCTKTMVLSIHTLAKVIWMRNIEKQNFEHGENRYRIGIEFLKIGKQDRQKIAKYIEESMSR